MQRRAISIYDTHGRVCATYFANHSRDSLHRNRIFPQGHRRGAFRLSQGLRWKGQRLFKALYERHTSISSEIRPFPEVDIHHESFS
jgi:hypothetical protein